VVVQRGFAPVSRSGDKRGAAQAGDASERGRGGRERGKGAGEMERRLERLVAGRSERSQGRSGER
jgi:hypothetical protein